MTRPEVVVFDLGKVLLDFDYQVSAANFAKCCGEQAPSLFDLLLRTPLLLRYETGLITTEAFFAMVCKHTGYTGTAREFARLFGDIFTPIEPMIQFQADLRRRGVPTFVLSNTNELAIQHIRATYPFFSQFDGYILSYEHGCMKPDPKLYRVVENLSSCHGPEILYMDDRPENTATAERLGWQVITHLSPEVTLPKVQELFGTAQEPPPATPTSRTT